MSGAAIRALSARVAGLRTGGAKLVLQRLMMMHMGGQDVVRCSVSALSRELGIKRDTVVSALHELEDEGLALRMPGAVLLRVTAFDTHEGEPELPLGVTAFDTPDACPVSGQGDTESLPGERAGDCPVSGQKLPGERAPLKEERKKGARPLSASATKPLDVFPSGLAQRELFSELQRFNAPEQALAEFRAVMAVAKALEACGKPCRTASEQRELFQFVRQKPELAQEIIDRRKARVLAHIAENG